MMDSGDGSARLRRCKQRILWAWEERARREIPAARGQDEPALLDHLPELLDRLANLLDSSDRSALEGTGRSLAAEHGEDRAQRSAYSLDQVVREYHLLREVLFAVVEEEEPLGTTERDALLAALELGIRNATRQFTHQRDLEIERIQRALQEANATLESEVKERTAELLRTEASFRAMVAVVEDYALFTVDPRGYIISWNAGAQRMNGYTPLEAIGQHFSMLYPEDGQRRDEPMAHLRTALVEGRFRGEGVRIRKNGEIFMADASITPMYEEGVLAGFAKIVQDLTERNVLIQERDLTRIRAERLELEREYRKRFVATLTHDLRSPLTVARTASQMIVRAAGEEEKVRTWAKRITDALERTDRMISDMLDASRVEAGERLPLKLESCDLRRLAEEVSEELSLRHGNRFAIESTGATTGFWSQDGLRRVLENLLSNAVKYGAPETPITTRIVRVDEHVLLSVHNHGTFIPPEERQQLFQPFRRARAAQASEKRGWGLGLTLVQGIVDAHGGMVKVESYPKEGTTFTVDLPADARSG